MSLVPLSCSLVIESCPTLCKPMDCMQSARLLCPWNFPGKNAGLHCQSLLQGVLLTQGSSPCLLHWQVDFLTTKPPGKPKYTISYGKQFLNIQSKNIGNIPLTEREGVNVGECWWVGVLVIGKEFTSTDLLNLQADRVQFTNSFMPLSLELSAV